MQDMYGSPANSEGAYGILLFLGQILIPGRRVLHDFMFLGVIKALGDDDAAPLAARPEDIQSPSQV
ncbi:hypothetical protein [Stigmatella hybrida]|uniref:hypothetical protein n=1 Tax=Stigmatella hybrida TaxID=394097 RepID=UPI001CDB44C1|nr:hypothetical protein [Stigmatella hybrida]